MIRRMLPTFSSTHSFISPASAAPRSAPELTLFAFVEALFAAAKARTRRLSVVMRVAKAIGARAGKTRRRRLFRQHHTVCCAVPCVACVCVCVWSVCERVNISGFSGCCLPCRRNFSFPSDAFHGKVAISHLKL